MMTVAEQIATYGRPRDNIDAELFGLTDRERLALAMNTIVNILNSLQRIRAYAPAQTIRALLNTTHYIVDGVRQKLP